MKNIYIGIDGGGTKTRAVIADSGFNIIGEGNGGSSNIRLSVTDSWNSIYSAINQALKPTGLKLDDKSLSFHIGLGLAGVSIKKAKEEFLNTPHAFKTLLLESDAHIACLGAHDGGNGAIISVGTGVIGYMISDGKARRFGGWGFPHADTGGGAWIGMEAVRLTFKWLDNCIEGSPLLEQIYARFNKEIFDMVIWACASKSTDFATVAPLVTAAADTGDKWGIHLMKKAAEEIDLISNAIKKESTGAGSRCYLLGGLSSLLHKYMADKKFTVLPPADINTPAQGALFMLKNHLAL